MTIKADKDIPQEKAGVRLKKDHWSTITHETLALVLGQRRVAAGRVFISHRHYDLGWAYFSFEHLELQAKMHFP